MRESLLVIGRRLRPGDAPASEAILGATRLLTRTLVEQGVRLSLLGLVDEGPPLRSLRHRGVRHYLVNRFRWGRGTRYHRWMRRLVSGAMLLEGRPDLLFINHFFAPLRPLRRGKQMAFLISVHNTFAHPPALLPETLILAENDSLAAAARRHYPRHRVELFPPGVDLHRFAPDPARTIEPPFRFLFASSPLPEHDTPAREQAVLNVRGFPLMMTLTRRLAGRLPMETVLLWRTTPAYVLGRIPSDAPVRVVARRIADMPAFWDGFDFCWALFRDAPDVKGMPQSLLEALAKGIPPIVRRGTPWAALLEPRGAAIVVDDPPRPADLQAIEEAARLPERYRRLSQAARRAAEELFDVEERARHLRRLLWGGAYG